MMLTYLTNIVKELSTKELIFVKNIYIGQTDYRSASNNYVFIFCSLKIVCAKKHK